MRRRKRLVPWAVVAVLAGAAAGGAVLATTMSSPSTPSSLRSATTTAPPPSTTAPVRTLPATSVPGTTPTPSTIVTPTPTGPPAPPAPGPLGVDAAAWRGHGSLAFVSDGQLEVLSSGGALAAITGPPAGSFDSNPAWSSDGRWLAFISNAPGSSTFDSPVKTLWLVAAGSTRAHLVTLGPIGAFAWSPTAPLLAFTPVPPSTRGQVANGPETIEFDVPGHAPYSVIAGSGDGVDTIAWSPSGAQLAFDDSDVAVRGSSPFGRLGVVTVATQAVHDVFTLTESRVALAGWWPSGQGLLFWEDLGFAEEADGEMLYSLPSYDLAGTAPAPVALVRSLVDPSYVVPDPGGTTVAVTAGMDRSIWASGRDVDVCSFPAQTCRGLPLPSGTEGLAPSFLASGPLVFVDASNSGPFSSGLMGRAFWSSGWMAQWDGTNRLSSVSGGVTRSVAGAPSGTVLAVPSATDNTVLAIADDALWLCDPTSGSSPVRVAGPLYSVTAPSGYYGEVPWSSTFAWSAAGVMRSGTTVGATYGESPLDTAIP